MRKILITGATGGIGSCIVNQLGNIEEELSICCIVRNKITVSSKKEILSIQFDLENSVKYDGLRTKIAQWICKEAGHTEEIVLVLAAAAIAPIEGVGILGKGIVKNITVNVASQAVIVYCVVCMCKRYDIPLRIIQFDSGAAYRPVAGWSLYCASKAYLSMFLQTLAVEDDCCKVVLFDPGVVDTKMQDYIRDSVSGMFAEHDKFLAYKESGLLHAAPDVAGYVIQNYISDWKAKSIKEKYR